MVAVTYRFKRENGSYDFIVSNSLTIILKVGSDLFEEFEVDWQFKNNSSCLVLKLNQWTGAYQRKAEVFSSNLEVGRISLQELFGFASLAAEIGESSSRENITASQSRSLAIALNRLGERMLSRIGHGNAYLKTPALLCYIAHKLLGSNLETVSWHKAKELSNQTYWDKALPHGDLTVAMRKEINNLFAPYGVRLVNNELKSGIAQSSANNLTPAQNIRISALAWQVKEESMQLVAKGPQGTFELQPHIGEQNRFAGLKISSGQESLTFVCEMQPEADWSLLLTHIQELNKAAEAAGSYATVYIDILDALTQNIQQQAIAQNQNAALEPAPPKDDNPAPLAITFGSFFLNKQAANAFTNSFSIAKGMRQFFQFASLLTLLAELSQGKQAPAKVIKTWKQVADKLTNEGFFHTYALSKGRSGQLVYNENMLASVNKSLSAVGLRVAAQKPPFYLEALDARIQKLLTPETTIVEAQSNKDDSTLPVPSGHNAGSGQ